MGQCLRGLMHSVPQDQHWVLFVLSNDPAREAALIQRLRSRLLGASTSNVTILRRSQRNIVTKTDLETLEAAIADNLLLALADVIVDGQAESSFVEAAGHISLRSTNWMTDSFAARDQLQLPVIRAFQDCERFVPPGIWPPMLAD